MKNIIELKVKASNDVTNRLMDICKYICKYYEEIKNEILQLSNSLELARECVVSYDDISIAKMNFVNYDEKLESEYLITIITSLQKIDEEFSKEFMQGVDFFNLGEQIFINDNRAQITNFISDSKRTMQYILYQIDRIYKAKTNTKKLAILKGMIAYS